MQIPTVVTEAGPPTDILTERKTFLLSLPGMEVWTWGEEIDRMHAVEADTPTALECVYTPHHARTKGGERLETQKQTERLARSQFLLGRRKGKGRFFSEN